VILGVTGHRDLCGKDARLHQYVLGFCEMAKRIDAAFEVITGMALGFDTIVADVCLELGVPFTAAIPFDKQEECWSLEQQDHYWDLLRKAKHREYVSTGPYHPAKYQKRNEWIVDNCELLLACWNGSSGGTANCVRYAERVGRQCKRIDPRSFK